jgi:hypothetical protein
MWMTELAMKTNTAETRIGSHKEVMPIVPSRIVTDVDISVSQIAGSPDSADRVPGRQRLKVPNIAELVKSGIFDFPEIFRDMTR